MGESRLRTQHNCIFPKHKKSVIFGILAKGGPHENFLEAQILEMKADQQFEYQ